MKKSSYSMIQIGRRFKAWVCLLGCLLILLAQAEERFMLAVANSAVTGVDLDNVELTALPMPPFRYYLSAPPPKEATHRLKLRWVSSQANSVIDKEEWFKKNDLELPIFDVPNASRQITGNVPAFIPTNYKNTMLVKAIRCKNAILLIYGADFSKNRYLIAVDPKSGSYLYGFDFINYQRAPKFVGADKNFIDQSINWAYEENNILYVSHAHNTYAKSSMGLNAYITALDKTTGKLLWRTKPLVSNAANFTIIAETIVAGYGFTAEPDYLYLLDKRTGKVYDQIKLKSGPEFLILKDNKLHVRTYDSDNLFEVTGF